jgi:SSS family solute:Na+ symporter
LGWFSIGLGGLGFTMGISGSWMLFTGLLGAWLSAVRFRKLELGHKYKFFTANLWYFYNGKWRFAGIISAIGISDSPVRRFGWSQISFGNN